ncbi:right-handed parallel beta-helix repeat-containing protein [Sandaracinus amylolyticus]|uniref:Right handed beta helix domain-containing protein n=1 Tax=Sandaracinus amylolyticus TaxID=927083 RepID=A0A0F6YI29_9BACT|nr:right-handed parallel beta-helix repeat-containing protein [Sandaracinus amylolyticus]AKF06272.1 hypothetical protein DB32_003421 [Sandaracinus amylolyticus]
MARLRLRSALVLAALALVACDAAPTALYLVVDTELAVPAEVDTLTIRVAREDGDPVLREIDLAASQRPVRVRIDPREDAQDAPIRIALAVRRGGDDVVTRTIATRFVRGSVRVLAVLLERACVAPSCGDERTCVAGDCVPPELDPTTLPVWDPRDEPDLPTRDAGAMDAATSDDDDAGITDVDAGPPDAWIDPESRSVANVDDLIDAVRWADARAGHQTILLAAGTYELPDVLVIDQPITLRGASRCGAVLRNDGTRRVLQVTDGAVTLDGLTITGGVQTDGHGGGLLVQSPAVVTLERSCVVGNAANAATMEASGGGIAVIRGGRLTVRDSDIVENGAGQQGGGLFVWDATVDLVDSDVSRNRITTDRDYTSGAGISSINSQLTLDRCLVSANETVATAARAADGGGLYAFQGSVRIASSTFASNRAHYGTAMLVQDVTVAISHSTIAGNTSTQPNGRAIWSPSHMGFTLEGSIVANNFSSASTRLNCHATITSLGGNVADELPGEADFDCGMQIGAAGIDRVGDPRLLPLQDRGGPTETFALDTGSAAIGFAGDECPDVDQRGVARTPPCDSGAFETE